MDKKHLDKQIKTDASAIPATDLRLLCSTLLDAVKRFYEDPQNIAMYEEWCSNRNGSEKIRPKERIDDQHDS